MAINYTEEQLYSVDKSFLIQLLLQQQEQLNALRYSLLSVYYITKSEKFVIKLFALYLFTGFLITRLVYQQSHVIFS